MRQITLSLALIAFGHSTGLAQTTGSEVVEQFSVELSNFAFTPSDQVLQHGQTYRLRLVNTASGGHDFDAREFFGASKIAPEDKAKVVDGRVELRGGESVEITLTPVEPGTYKLHCSHFMHGVFGMRGSITVE